MIALSEYFNKSKIFTVLLHDSTVHHVKYESFSFSKPIKLLNAFALKLCIPIQQIPYQFQRHGRVQQALLV